MKTVPFLGDVFIWGGGGGYMQIVGKGLNKWDAEIQPYRLHTTHNMNNAAAVKIARI
jgi:hypothetical protein